MARTLLIVDDINSNRKILKNMLGEEYAVIEAEHGREALAIMERDNEQISAVLLDLGMPIMDGYEVLAYMRDSARLSQLPVIVTTGQTDAGSEERALKLGAKDYISKPYQSAIIRQRIRNTINLRETAAAVNTLQKDRLTGVWNRETFFQKAAAEIAEKPAGYYVLGCVDIDGFKVINDQYGNDMGDRVIKALAQSLQDACDVNGGVCGRIFADCFVCLYPERCMDTSFIGSQRLETYIGDRTGMRLTLSVGRYIVTDTTLSVSAMYDRATIAQHTIKGRYDKHVAVYDESMRSHIVREQEIVNDMNHALAEGQFEAWFQPQYNHANGALIGAEALVRWRHPTRGLVSPGEFVPVFEQNGFIYELDKYVWEAVCRYLRKEIDAGRSPLPVSVNISRYDVFCEGFYAAITGLVERYGIPVDLLRLEITESAFAESTKRIVAVVKRLIDFGFTLEIDDFGSGYSSLNTLKNVPAQVVKLDMRFLEDDDGSQRGGNIIESVVRMTKWLGMSIIAEGVEKKSQADYLLSIGCNYVQGYLYAEPMPESTYRAFCDGAGKEEKLLALETAENLDNNAFWDPDSMDTLIFNSYVGAACIYEFHQGNIELLRVTKKYTQHIGHGGMTAEEALKLDWKEHLAPESRMRIVADLQRSIELKQEIAGEYVFFDLPGCPRETYLRSTMRVIAVAGDRYLVYCMNEDITAQRIAEQRERAAAERLRTVMDNVSCGITAVTFDGKAVIYVFANNRYYELLGYTEEQYRDEIGDKAFQTVYPEDATRIAAVTARVSETGTPDTMEYRAIRRDGRVVWMRSLVSMAEFDSVEGRVQLSTFTDITEEKHAEQALLDTTEQMRVMMNDMPGGFARMQVENGELVRSVYYNDGFLKMVGMTDKERRRLIADDIYAGVCPEDVPIAKAHFVELLQYEAPRSARYRLRNGSGDFIWLSITGRVSKDVSGETFLNFYYADVSEQIKEEERKRELLDNLPYGTALYEFDGSKLAAIHLNKRYWELVNRSAEKYFGIGFLNAVYAADREVISRELAAAIREGRDIVCDLRILYGEDEYRPFHIVGRILRKEDGKYSIYAVYTPISDEAMSIQEMLPVALNAMMRAQTEFAFVKDKSLRYVCSSDAVAKLVHAASAADMVGKTDYDFFDKSLADAFAKDDRYVLSSGQSLLDIHDRLSAEDGQPHYACTSKFPLKDSQGNILGVYGIGRDVTETRRMETQLALLTNNIPGGIVIYEGRPDALAEIFPAYFSDGFCRLFGYEREEYGRLAKTNPVGLVFPDDMPGMHAQILALVQDGVPIDYVYRAKTKGGVKKWINVKAVMGEPDGKNLTVNAVFFDVTDHQETLEHLRISEEENRLAMQHTNNTVCRYNVKTHTLRLPQGPLALFGLPEQLTDVPEGPIARGNISPETADAYRTFYRSIQSGNKSGETAFQRKSECGWRWIEAHFSTIFSDAGVPVSAVISFTDVTEQLEKDSAYKRWQQTYESKPQESYSLYRCNVTKRTGFDAREGALLKMEFAPGEFDFNERTFAYATQHVIADDRERFISFLHTDALLSGYYQGKRIVQMEFREKLAGGGYRWLRLTVDLVAHAHSGDIEAYLLYEDIDKAKRQEIATIEQAESDPLTGVLNRVAFVAQVNDCLKMSKPNRQHALLMLDIDGFKQVNDAFGHRAGDRALVEITEGLRSVLCGEEIVGRLGGDEFLIFLPEISDDSIAATKAKQICALTRRSFSAEVEISASVGIAIAPRDGEDLDTLYKKADSALYYVKGSGKDSYAFYQEDMVGEHLRVEELSAQENGAIAQVKKRRMLIVDDSRIDHAMLTHIFADTFIIEKAKDGNSALIRLRHYGSAISVVLLDLVMPGMDGFAVLKKMQENTELRTIPVIVVSGDESRETGLRAIRAGAVDFVNKPVDPEILRIRVQSAIAKLENERLHAKNSFLEYQNNEIVRYRTALERSGIAVIENDWVAGTFIYDATICRYIAGKYDTRSLWHILLSDFVAETLTVQKMQGLVHAIAVDRKRSEGTMLVQLKAPDNGWRWFRMQVYKAVNEFGMAGKIYMTFTDLGKDQPNDSNQRTDA